MTPIEMEDTSTERTQRPFARVAGFLFLWLIIAGLAGALTVSSIVGSGTFAETAKGVVASIDAGIDLARVTRYELQVKIQPSEEHLTASARITPSNPTAAPLREIPFLLYRLLAAKTHLLDGAWSLEGADRPLFQY